MKHYLVLSLLGCSLVSATNYVTGVTKGYTVNNSNVCSGMAFTVGPNPLTVTAVGRRAWPRDSGTHLVKFVLASGATDVVGGSATVNMAGSIRDTFVYQSLAGSITLAANTAYYLVSKETSGGDHFGSNYNGTLFNYITTTVDATQSSAVYSNDTACTTYNTTSPGTTYGPLDFVYTGGVQPVLSATLSHTGNFSQGQTGATYTIGVSNTGVGPTSGTVTVTDNLPPGLVLTGLAGTGWTCTVGILTCTRSDALAASGSYPNITVTVTARTFAQTPQVNSVTVSGGTSVPVTVTDSTTIVAVGTQPYVDGTVLRLAPGVTSITLCDNSPVNGGCYVQGLNVDINHRAHVWMSTAGFNCVGDGDCKSTVDCTDAAAQGVSCSALINRAWGNYMLRYQVYLANDTTPGTPSSALSIPAVEGACETAPFTVPTEISGTSGRRICKNVTIAGGEDVSALQFWVHQYNWKDGAVTIQVGSGTPMRFKDNPVNHILCAISNGPCTIGTLNPHGFTVGQVVYFNGAMHAFSGGTGLAPFNGPQTVVSTPAANSFTIANPITCGGSPCTFSQPDWTDTGVTVAAWSYMSEDRWYGGLRGPHQPMEVAMPVANGTVTAGATNKIEISFSLAGAAGTSLESAGAIGGKFLRWNLVQPWQTINQIVISGCPGPCLATVTLANAVPAAWHNGDTIIIRDAPGPEWLFSHERVIGGISGSTFTFPIVQPAVGSWTPDNGTYAVPTSKEPAYQSPPAMYAARALIPTSSFQTLDPNNYPVTGVASAGAWLWSHLRVKSRSDYLPNHTSNAQGCSSCHDDRAFDMKYFSFSPDAIITGALERGGSVQDGLDIFAFVNSNPIPYTGRPWSPVYQPAIGLDSLPLRQWAAGGGPEWKLNFDNDIHWFVAPGCTHTLTGCAGGDYSKWAPGGSGGGAATSILNFREIPKPFMWPEWLRWLPTIAPEDIKYYLVDDFTNYVSPLWNGGSAYQLIENYIANTTTPTLLSALPSNCTAAAITLSSGANIHTSDYLQILDPTAANKYEYIQVTSGAGTTTPTVARCQKGTTSKAWAGNGTEVVPNFTNYAVTNGAFAYANNQSIGEAGGFAALHRPCSYATIFGQQQPCDDGSVAGYWWPSQLSNALVSVYNWSQSKLWDLANSQYLYNMADQTYQTIKGVPNARAAAQDQRGWGLHWTFNRGPHKLIGGNRGYLGNVSAFSTVFFNCETEIWYDVPTALENGNRLQGADQEFDIGYYYAFFQREQAGCGSERPHFYTMNLIAPMVTQQSWGWPLISNMPNINPATSGVGTLGPVVNQETWENDLFVTTAEEGELLAQYAQLFLNTTQINSQNVPAWQAAFGPTTTSQTSMDAANGRTNAFNPGNALAYALSVFAYYGVSSTLLNQMTTFLDSVFTGYTSGGGSFTRYTNPANIATCSLQQIGTSPKTVICGFWP